MYKKMSKDQRSEVEQLLSQLEAVESYSLRGNLLIALVRCKVDQALHRAVIRPKTISHIRSVIYDYSEGNFFREYPNPKDNSREYTPLGVIPYSPNKGSPIGDWVQDYFEYWT